MPYPLTVVEYDPAWPGIYEVERTLLAPAFGAYLLDIQHVGSTSVAGLAAKPIIDIAVATDRYPLPDETIAAVEALGYEHRGENGVPRRHYFRKYAAMEYHGHAAQGHAQGRGVRDNQR